MAEDYSKYQTQYSRESFFAKVKDCAKSAGREVLVKAFQLYYTLDNPALPAWARTAIIGAAGYFILPIDAVPDIIPAAGFADDLAVLAGAIATTAMYTRKEDLEKAEAAVDSLLG